MGRTEDLCSVHHTDKKRWDHEDRCWKEGRKGNSAEETMDEKEKKGKEPGAKGRLGLTGRCRGDQEEPVLGAVPEGEPMPTEEGESMPTRGGSRCRREGGSRSRRVGGVGANGGRREVRVNAERREPMPEGRGGGGREEMVPEGVYFNGCGEKIRRIV